PEAGSDGPADLKALAEKMVANWPPLSDARKRQLFSLLYGHEPVLQTPEQLRAAFPRTDEEMTSAADQVVTVRAHDDGNTEPATPTRRHLYRGHWMQTFTGRQFFPMNPRPEEVHAADIAHALSMQCRYNGHVRRFYSVAEHCVHLSYAVGEDNALWALLHDATEAYVGDMVAPLTRHMSTYRETEDRVSAAIAEPFGLDPEMPQEVRTADRRILLDERAALMTPAPADWGLDQLEPLGVQIMAWPPHEARRHYLNRLHELIERSTP